MAAHHPMIHWAHESVSHCPVQKGRLSQKGKIEKRGQRHHNLGILTLPNELFLFAILPSERDAVKEGHVPKFLIWKLVPSESLSADSR